MVAPATLELAAAVARYHAKCLQVIGAQNVAQVDVRAAKRAAYPCDLGLLTDTEQLLRHRRAIVSAPVAPVEASPEEVELHQRREAVWARLQELALKASQERHLREVLYGAPLLGGALPRKTGAECQPVLAPLFLQSCTVEVQTDGSLLIEASDEPPRFNSAMWSGLPARETEQIVTFGIDAQADLADGWDDDRIEELLSGIRSVFAALRLTRIDNRLAPWPERPAPAGVADRPPHLELHAGAVLYLANKASPYLLADLEEIAREPDRFVVADRPLSVLLSPPADEARPELEHLDIHEVVFPFPSNGPQRRVVDAVAKNRIVLVQGPPGTGKSLTIANLVAHLVANGKSVLVCSHKEQALTVVRDKLDEMDLEFLYASMVGTGAAAKRELQGQIQNVRGFTTKVNQHTMRRQLKEVAARRRRNGERYQELRDDFNHRAEAEQAEAEKLALQLEGIALLPDQDPIVAVSDQPAVTAGLKRLDTFARRHRQVWPALVESPLADDTNNTAAADALDRFLKLQDVRLKAAEHPTVASLVREWQVAAERRPAEIELAAKKVDAVVHALSGPVAEAEDDPDPALTREIAKALAADADNLHDAKDAIGKLTDALESARQKQDARHYAPPEAVAIRAEVVRRHGELKAFLKRRAARRWLDEHAPGTAGLTEEQVGEWAAFWDAWRQVRDVCDALGGALRLELPDRYDPTRVSSHLARLRRAYGLASALVKAREVLRGGGELRLGGEALLQDPTPAALEDYVNAWRSALAALRAARDANDIIADPALRWIADDLAAADAAVEEDRYDEARPLLECLRAMCDALPDLAQRATVLKGATGLLAGAVAEIERRAAAGEAVPAFMSALPAAFAAQHAQHRLAEIESGTSTRAIAEELEDLRRKILDDAKRYLSLRIKERIYEGFRRPAFNASLERFRKAISTSAKRFDRVEELKNSSEFDVDVLTKVFPCWIMRPEDACRIFPLRRDVFDVVIFDEASQCNPDQALPLFARAQHAVIFGDDKQLSNEELQRSLAVNTNRTILKQTGLAELDPSGLFDQRENSLLGLVAHRDQAPIMLDEHFRCRPELIAFSNRQFYGEALRVMRDSEDDRGLGPAMLIHELRGVPPLGKTKVNRYEAEALVDELCRLLADPAYRGLSFGVLSLFKEQIEHIEQLVDRRIPAEERRRRRLICSTVDGFQGDERDVILYSWRYTPNTWSPAIFSFTNGRSGDQRINVALTRARHQAIHFISAPVDEFPQGGNVGLFLQHAHAPEHLLQRVESRVHREPLTVARRRASDALRRAGLRVTEQFVASGVGIDLVVHHPDTGARVAVFVDGEIDPEPPPTADRRVDAHGLLERAGWIVVRILATEALSDPAGVERRVRSGLERCGPRNLPNPDGQRMFVINVRERERAAGDAAPISAPVPSADMTITREDRADYHWPAAPLEKRLLKEDVFQSDFERDLHDRLARNCDLKVVPQWPSRGKFIDLVITDRAGRRLAIEADGEQHHLTVDGELIPEDVHRQKLLEEVGWVFHRVRHSDFRRDPDGQVEAILRHLAEQPVNERLAAETWAEAADLDELDDIVAHDVTSPPAGQLLSDKVGSLAAPFSESGSAVSGSQEVLIGPGGVQQQQQLALSGDVDEYLSADEGSLEREPTDRESTSALPAVVEPTREEIDPYGYRGAHLDDVPLAIWPMQIALAVQERGPLVASEIPAAYAEVFGVEVPRSRHRLLTSFAWSAGGRNFIRWDDEDRWIPGDTEPQAMNHLAPWTMNQITQVVRALLDQGVDIDDLFKRTISIVWPSGHRVPRPIARAVGSCVYAVAGRR